MKLEIRDIRKTFDKTEILHGLHFTVQSGRAMGFLRRNGAGKTTTFRCLMKVFSQDSGDFLLDGQPFDPSRNRIGYLPEERGMYSKATLKDQLTYFARLKGAPAKKAAEEAEHWIRYFGLEEYTNKKLETLSKGNQQKIQIAQAFLNDPDIIILDEPFSGLDPVNAQIFKDAIHEAVQKEKLVIFSSHQMAYVEEMCDEITLIDRGSIVLTGALDEIRAQEGRGKVVLEVPPAQERAAEKLLYSDLHLSYTKKDGQYLISHEGEDTLTQQLLKALIDGDIHVLSFGQYRPGLQDIFVNKVGETHA